MASDTRRSPPNDWADPGEYLSEVLRNGRNYLPVVCRLLSLQVCPRCCLRFCRVRGHVYTRKPPRPVDTFEAAAKLWRGAGAVAMDQGAAGGPDEHGIISPEPKAVAIPKDGRTRATDGAGQDGVDADSSASADECVQLPDPGAVRDYFVCALCLGILQALDAVPGAPCGEGFAEPLPARRWNHLSWKLLPDGSLGAMKRLLDSSGRDVVDFSLGVSLPGGAGLREASMLRFLKDNVQSTEAQARGAEETFPVGPVVPLREVVRQCVIHFMAASCGLPHYREGPFSLMLSFRHPQSQKEVQLLQQLSNRGQKKKRPRGGTSESGHEHEVLNDARAAEMALNMDWQEFKNTFKCPPCGAEQAAETLARMHHAPLFLGGRYLKTHRDISHTPFFVNGQRVGRTSVQEVLADAIRKVVDAADFKLISAGREDMDVRMLGKGRPFVIEIEDPRVHAIQEHQVQAILADLSDQRKGVVARALRVCGREVVEKMKEGEETKRKVYVALVWAAERVEDHVLHQMKAKGAFSVEQDTPIRVLHRRAALVRSKQIFAMQCQRIPSQPNYFIVRVEAAAGCYIKELIDGDCGRTRPSVSSMLGCDARCVQLDVTDVKMDIMD
ncbi:unnamed protein product [Ostreobium quekettii]|uniref:tRNA pseudouridine(55) synthase n=1 Tax=Ostreobium quekettii TaxID=121088 RepID=A0A8S1IPR9_9CHLO|nr:unnamed protein product [Ostreobium quekettii]